MKPSVVASAVLVLLATLNAWADDIEVIEVRAERNRLLTTEVAQDNTSAVMLADSAMTKLTLADWMALEPGISLSGQGGLLQSYSLRGFSRARIRTEIDGVPIMTDRRAGNSASFISPFLINRIDVQKGPSSTLYGSEAMGGVINLVSSEMDTNALTVNTQTSNQQQELGFLLGLENWQTGFSYRHANNAKAANGELLNTRFEQFAGLVKYQSNVASFGDIKVNASWLPSVGKNIGKSSNQYPNERIVDYPEEVHSVSQVSLEHANQWFMKLYHHYQNWDSNTLRVAKRKNITEYHSQTLGGLALVTTQWLGGQGRAGFDWLSRLSVDIHETELDLANHINFSKQVVDGRQDNFGLFSDLYWQFDNTLVSAGARYDVISQRQYIEDAETSDNQLNASLSIRHQLSPIQAISIEWATGFRFPTLSELYFEGETPRGTTLGNAALKPEKSNGIQAKWMKSFSATWQIDAESYYYQLDNYIERYSVSEGIRSYRNLDKAKIYGAELKVSWQGNGNFSDVSMLWAGQYQIGKNNAGDYLADLLPGNVSWQITWLRNELSIVNQFKWQFSHSKVGSGELPRNSALLWELSASLQISDDLVASVYGNNLTNEDIYATADEDSALIQGRVIGIKLDWQF